MATSIIDSDFFKDHYSTQEMRDIFEDAPKLQRRLDVEVALAQVQAELGIIPKEAAEEITAKAKVELLDLDAFKDDLAKTGHHVVAMVRAVERLCDNKNGEYVHFGVTSQDIIDTAIVLGMRDATRIFFRDAIELEAHILRLSEKYIDFPMAGRTHNQHALPITLGLKFANWATELRRCIERMKDMSERCFIILLHGAVGTLAGFGDDAYPILEGVAKKLDLGVPPNCWANARDSSAEFLSVLGIMAGCLARIANEIFVLSRTEVAEMHEPLSKNHVGSSTMPHKRNAIRCETAVAQARLIHTNAMAGYNAMINVHERDVRAWRVELLRIPESCVLLGKMLNTLVDIVGKLAISEKNITRNLDYLGGMILSEAVMFHLAEKVGKQTSHHLVHEVTMITDEDQRSFRQRLMDSPEIRKHMTVEELEGVLDYSKYLGQSINEVKNSIAYCKSKSVNDAQFLNI